MNTVAGLAVSGGSNDQVLPAHGHTASGESTFTGSALPNHSHTFGLFGNTAGFADQAASSPQPQANTETTSAVSAGTPAGSVSTTVTVVSAGVAPVGGENRPAFKGVAIWERTA